MTARFAVSFSAPMLIVMAFALAPAKVHYNISPSTFWFLWLGILALFVVMIYAKSREMRKRREALAQLALENGFAFSQYSDSTIQAEIEQIKVAPGQLDSNPRFRNILRGNRAHCDVAVYDRVVGNGKTQTVSTIIAFNLAASLPSFILCNESALWRLADKLGYKDIDIESAPEFSSRFFLHAQDEAAVRTLFTPDIVRVFEQLPPDWNVQGSANGTWLTFSRPGRLISPEQILDILRNAEGVVSAFQSRKADVFSS